jgi:oligopeptide transport system substrate-binding protein
LKLFEKHVKMKKIDNPAGGKSVKRVWSFLCSIVLLAVSLCGCGIAKNANKAINVKLSAEPTTLDPQVAQGSDAATVISALYEGLCRLDSSGKAVAGAASSWEANSGSTEFTFHIRSNAVWNGNVQALISGNDSDASPTPLTADDFVFAWRRALEASTASPACTPMMCIQNALQVHAGTLSADKLGVTAKDRQTLIVRLRYSCPDFPQLTATSVFMPCNEKFFNYAAGRYGMDRETILGNGPFIIPNYGWTHDVSLTLNRSNMYAGQSAAVPAAIAFTIGDSSSGSSTTDSTSAAASSNDSSAAVSVNTVQSLINGKLDIAALDASDEPSARKAGLTVTSFQDTTVGLCFNTSGVFHSAALRRAFVQVLNRSSLMQIIPVDAQAASGILPPAMTFGGQSYRSQAKNETYLKQSASAAAVGSKLLPKNPQITLLCTNETKALASRMLASWNQAFQTYFSLNAVDSSSLLSSVRSGSYTIAVYPYTPASADAYTALASFQSGQGGNFTQLKDPAYDQLLNSGTVSSSALAEAEKYLNDKAVFYPIYYEKHFYAAQPSLSGVLYYPFGGGLDLHSAAKTN